VFIIQDNARPHTCVHTVEYMNHLKVLLPHSNLCVLQTHIHTTSRIMECTLLFSDGKKVFHNDGSCTFCFVMMWLKSFFLSVTCLLLSSTSRINILTSYGFCPTSLSSSIVRFIELYNSKKTHEIACAEVEIRCIRKSDAAAVCAKLKAVSKLIGI
jgi:hypothetical protein